MSKYRYISNIVEFHKSKNYLKKPRGCNDCEIDAVERELGLVFPIAYREYLSWMGKDSAGLLVGSDAFIGDVVGNTLCLDEILNEENLEHFKSNKHVCFFSHQGYVLYWFYETDEPNPVCYEYIETADGLRFGETKKFTDVVFDELRGMAKAIESNQSLQSNKSPTFIKRILGFLKPN